MKSQEPDYIPHRMVPRASEDICGNIEWSPLSELKKIDKG